MSEPTDGWNKIVGIESIEAGEISAARPHREAFRAALATELTGRNYVSAYVARRCRVTVDEVSAWVSGARIPRSEEWDYLVRMDKDLSRFSHLRDSALTEPAPPPRAQRETTDTGVAAGPAGPAEHRVDDGPGEWSPGISFRYERPGARPAELRLEDAGSPQGNRMTIEAVLAAGSTAAPPAPVKIERRADDPAAPWMIVPQTPPAAVDVPETWSIANDRTGKRVTLSKASVRIVLLALSGFELSQREESALREVYVACLSQLDAWSGE